jgi:cullin 3
LENVVRVRLAASVSPSLLLDRTPADTLDQSNNERRAAGERILAAIKEAWEDHQLCMGMITDVLMYMVIPPAISPLFLAKSRVSS